MKVVVTGATGSIGTSLLEVLAADAGVGSVVGISRRRPALSLPKVTWAQADVGRDDLVPLFSGAAAVVHLAWAVQGARDPEASHRTNVIGSARVVEAVAAAGVPTIAFSSSIAAYSPGPKDPPVDESWPTHGVAGSLYSAHKSYVERLLDRLEDTHPETRVVRLRPCLVVKREAATGLRKLFLGPFVPATVFRHRAVPIIPDIPDLRFQVVHSDDVAEAFRLVIHHADARGAYNVAAGEVIGPPELARLTGARTVPVPGGLAHLAVSLAWRLHLQPTDPAWLDVIRRSPAVDAGRLRRELGWSPSQTSGENLDEVIEGLGAVAEHGTPPLRGG